MFNIIAIIVPVSNILILSLSRKHTRSLGCLKETPAPFLHSWWFRRQLARPPHNSQRRAPEMIAQGGDTESAGTGARAMRRGWHWPQGCPWEKGQAYSPVISKVKQDQGMRLEEGQILYQYKLIYKARITQRINKMLSRDGEWPVARGIQANS